MSAFFWVICLVFAAILVLLTAWTIILRAQLSRRTAEHKATENELQRLSTAVEQTPASIMITDPKGNIQFVNKNFEEVSGYSAVEVLGKNPRILKSGEMPQAIFQELWDTVLNGREWRGEFHNKHKNGTFYWESATIVPILSGEGKVLSLLGIKLDITEKKKLEAQLLQAQKMELIGTLAGGIAHDLNNQMTPVLGYLDIFIREHKDNSQEVDIDILVEAQQAAQRCVDIVKKIKDVSRPSSHQKSMIKLQNILNETRTLFQTVLPKTIEMAVYIDDDLWPVYGNEGEIETVLMNLVTNAKDAMLSTGGQLLIEAGNAQLTAEQLQHHSHSNHYIFIRVQDTGSGILPDVLPHIFEPFYTTKRKEGGSGLGLAMALNIVTAHKGWIDVASEVDKGSVFTIYLPAKPDAKVEQRPSQETSALPRGEGLILFADDEENVRNVGRLFLEKLGYQVIMAKDGMEAVRVYKDNYQKIRLVVLDMTMPKLTGRETLRKILEVNPNAKIVVSSGYTSEGTSEDLMHDGALAYLTKPYAISTFAAVIAKTLNK